ncbi:MAG: hypothetical protein LBI42_09060 [Chitinispirillales bacterium]|jgi:hypothetical protein|nr:hypothetical protein [Chitinispirillales bacterium]
MNKLLLVTAALAVTLTSCFIDDKGNDPVKSGNGPSNAAVEVILGDGTLPYKLFLELSTDKQETIYDTVIINSKNISRTFFDLAPHAEWKINAYTVNRDDSIMHTGTNTFSLPPNQTTKIIMELQANYFSMHAFFTHAAENMTRAEIIVDDRYTFVSPAEGGDTITVDIDYIPLKSQYYVKGIVYGMYNGAEVLLYAGDTTVTLPWYDDNTVIFTLLREAAHPGQGSETMSVWLLPEGGNTHAGRIGQPIYFSGTGHYYDVVTFNRNITWDDAKVYAEALSYKGMQGHLVAITSAEENDFVWRYLAAQSGVTQLFIGGYQYPKTSIPDLNWNWVTGESWGYTNWKRDEPNDRNGNDEIWLTMWAYAGTWNDQIDRLRGYIVEFGPPRQQASRRTFQSFIREVLHRSPLTFIRAW